MGFAQSVVAWMVVILFIALIVIGVLTFILNWVYPQIQEEVHEDGTTLSSEELAHQSRETILKRNLFLVVVAVLAVLAVTGSISGLINLSPNA